MPSALKTQSLQSSLSINASKTKEFVFSNKRSELSPPSITIGSHLIEQVDTYKYLGNTLHEKLNFDPNTDTIISKAENRLSITKQLANHKVKTSIIQLACKRFIEIVLVYNLPVIYGHLSADNIWRYNRIINRASRLSHGELNITNLSHIYDHVFKTKCLEMTTTSSDGVLGFDKLPSGRLRVVKHPVNVGKFCFRSKSVTYYSKLFSQMFMKFYYFIFLNKGLLEQ